MKVMIIDEMNRPEPDTILGLNERVQLYYDHYKESCSLRKEVQGRRNKSFVVLCILEAFSFLLMIKPGTALEILEAGINTSLETVLTFGNGTIQTLLWVLIAYVLIRYCQDTLYVERQYKYEDKLESEISGLIKYNLQKENMISREGTYYLWEYPIVLNIIDLFYKMFMPIVFTGINIVRIVKEWQMNMISISLVCDSAIFCTIFIITWFFFFALHSKLTEWCKKHIPLVNRIAVWLRKILKEV